MPPKKKTPPQPALLCENWTYKGGDPRLVRCDDPAQYAERKPDGSKRLWCSTCRRVETWHRSSELREVAAAHASLANAKRVGKGRTNPRK